MGTIFGRLTLRSLPELEFFAKRLEKEFNKAINSNDIIALEELYDEFHKIREFEGVFRANLPRVSYSTEKLVCIGRMISVINSIEFILENNKIENLSKNCPSKLKLITKMIGDTKRGIMISDVLGRFFLQSSLEMEKTIKKLESEISDSPLNTIKSGDLSLYYLSDIGQKYYNRYLFKGR